MKLKEVLKNCAVCILAIPFALTDTFVYSRKSIKYFNKALENRDNVQLFLKYLFTGIYYDFAELTCSFNKDKKLEAEVIKQLLKIDFISMLDKCNLLDNGSTAKITIGNFDIIVDTDTDVKYKETMLRSEADNLGYNNNIYTTEAVKTMRSLQDSEVKFKKIDFDVECGMSEITVCCMKVHNDDKSLADYTVYEIPLDLLSALYKKYYNMISASGRNSIRRLSAKALAKQMCLSNKLEKDLVSAILSIKEHSSELYTLSHASKVALPFSNAVGSQKLSYIKWLDSDIVFADTNTALKVKINNNTVKIGQFRIYCTKDFSVVFGRHIIPLDDNTDLFVVVNGKVIHCPDDMTVSIVQLSKPERRKIFLTNKDKTMLQFSAVV